MKPDLVTLARRTPPAAGHRERGATLIIALISLVILSISALALMRSTNATLFMAGNLAFKRDVVNHAERALATAIKDLRNNMSDAARESNATARNYSASVLASSDEGIPLVLLKNADYTAAGFTRADLVDTASSVTMRYVIDRQCDSGTGAFDPSKCQNIAVTPSSATCDGRGCDREPGADRRPAYRITVRITGPRGIQTFVQATQVL
jgi:type IV pilus assembly protein PilX